MTDGQPMRSLDWLYPSVVAGSLRSLLARQVGRIEPDRLRNVSVHGLFPLADSGCGRELHLPAPADISARHSPTCGSLEAFASRPEPIPTDCGCSGVWSSASGCQPISHELADEGLQPVTLSPRAGDDFKPEKLPAWWSLSRLAEWLANPTGENFDLPTAGVRPDGFLESPVRDHRVHVVIDPDSLAVKNENALFQTTGLSVERLRRGDRRVEAKLAIRVELDSSAKEKFEQPLQSLSVESPLGGERRLVHWRSDGDVSTWSCPVAIRDALRQVSVNGGGVRLMLATPAIFSRGWMPGWLNFDTSNKCWLGTPPGLTAGDVTLRLVGVRCERWLPISGWDYETGKPKAIRRMVPAGAIYFFTVESGNPAVLSDQWLRSVCDDSQDQRDGFGLGAWGIWQPHPKCESRSDSPKSLGRSETEISDSDTTGAAP
jgi:CRISPR-associated protein Cmr3